jgi:hypothetical protein
MLEITSKGEPMSFWRPVAIVILPLVGLFFERDLDEPVTGLFGPALFSLYVVGVLAFGALFVGQERLPPAATSIAAGSLVSGSLIVGFIAVFGTGAACFILLMSLPLLAPSHLSLDRVVALAGAVVVALVLLSPWFTSRALGELAARALQTSRARIGEELTFLCAILGFGLAIGLATLATKADTAWLTPRLQVFDGDDVGEWEKSLSEIKARWLCGHRRCLMDVCHKLDMRFDRTSGQSGPFASPIALVVEAPNVPEHLAVPFEKIYSYPFRQVCVMGD